MAEVISEMEAQGLGDMVEEYEVKEVDEAKGGLLCSSLVTCGYSSGAPQKVGPTTARASG